jgi:hydrogenase maturation protease
MGDDGLGLVALEALRAGWRLDPHVELIDGGTWGMNLLPFIEGAERLLFLDAVDAGLPPGSLISMERDELPRFFALKLSPHQIDLREVLALAEFRGTLPKHTVALGLQPERVEMSTRLSSAVSDALDHLVEAAIDRLKLWGHTVQASVPAEGS